jgi:hypothetical protein
MIKLNFFVHYFEIFVGFNAAIAGFEDTRKMIYGFFSWRTDKLVEYEAQRINAGLQKIKVNLTIYDKLSSEKNLSVNTAPPMKTAEFDLIFIEFTNKYTQCQEEAKQLKKDIEEHEKEYVEKRVPPWLIFCLLYCIMLILLCGFTENYRFVAHYSFIYLAYFNFIVLGAFSFNQTYNSFLKKPINNWLMRFNKNLRLGKKRNVHHPYFYVYRHIKRFFLVLGVSLLLTCLSWYLAFIHYQKFLFQVWQVGILFETLIICIIPLAILIFCAIIWKNRHIKPILLELKKECQKISPAVKQMLDWVSQSQITY